MSSAEVGYEVESYPDTYVPPEPGEESAGPSLSELNELTLHSRLLAKVLADLAERQAAFRSFPFLAPGQTDGSGNATVPLFSVPAGAYGRLVWLALDEQGVTPNSPDAGANLWHGIYAGTSPTASSFVPSTAVLAVGNLLDFRTNGATAGKSRIPDVYAYQDRFAAPTLLGPATFYLVVQAANANKQIFARGVVYVEQQNARTG